MANLSVCVETVFSSMPYAERIRRVAELGFTACEFWFHDRRFDGRGLSPEPKDFQQIAELNQRHGLKTVAFVFNHPGGGVVASLVDARDRPLLLDSIDRMAGLARSIGCDALISGSGDRIPGLERQRALDTMTETLARLAPLCARNGITLLVEPFNTRVDHPDCFLDDPETCVQMLRQVNSPNIRMLFDIYHMQIMHGDILAFVKKNLPFIGHFHVAGVPGRAEPSPCELDYAFILRQIDALGYTGYFGLEYWPTRDPAESLATTRRALIGR